jgi:anti-sigma factor RsiW
MADSRPPRDLIDAYLNGTIDAAELAELNRLLETDPAAADELAAAAAIDEFVERYFYEEPYREEMRSTLARLAPPRRRVAPWLAVAAALLVAIGGLTAWQVTRRPEVPYEVLSGRLLVEGVPTERIVEGTPVVVGGAEPAVLQLTDGTRAELDPESEAIVHGPQGATRQVVELRSGSGLFRVPKGDGRFRVETAVGSVTSLGTEFSVDYSLPHSEGESAMRTISTGIAALAVSVVTGMVQVDIQNKSFTLSSGESRVFAAAPADKRAEKKASLPPPSSDLLGFEVNGKSVSLEFMFPGVTAALLLTDEQKEQFRAARAETVESEAVRTAGATIKSNPEARAEQREKAQKVINAARKELLAKTENILTAEQKALVKKLSAAAADAQKAASEQFQDERAAAKGDKTKVAELQEKMREPLAAEFQSRVKKFLSAEQLAAMEEAAAARKAAEERAKTDPKKKATK